MATWSKLIWCAALAGGAWAATRGRPQPFDVATHLDGGTLRPVRNGRLYHRTVGAGPDLVMLPGFGGNVRTWEFITPPLAQTHRVHWIDLLGHGLSDKPATADYGAQAQAERLEELLSAEGLDRVVITASSAGGQPAVSLAARHPRRVAGLVLGRSLPGRRSLRSTGHLAEPAAAGHGGRGFAESERAAMVRAPGQHARAAASVQRGSGNGGSAVSALRLARISMRCQRSWPASILPRRRRRSAACSVRCC